MSFEKAETSRGICCGSASARHATQRKSLIDASAFPERHDREVFASKSERLDLLSYWTQSCELFKTKSTTSSFDLCLEVSNTVSVE